MKYYVLFNEDKNSSDQCLSKYYAEDEDQRQVEENKLFDAVSPIYIVFYSLCKVAMSTNKVQLFNKIHAVNVQEVIGLYCYRSN